MVAAAEGERGPPDDGKFARTSYCCVEIPGTWLVRAYDVRFYHNSNPFAIGVIRDAFIGAPAATWRAAVDRPRGERARCPWRAPRHMPDLRIRRGHPSDLGFPVRLAGCRRRSALESLRRLSAMSAATPPRTVRRTMLGPRQSVPAGP